MTAAPRSSTEARDALIEANLPLVIALCNRLRWHQAEREDLYQQGCIGLLMAAERFDPTRGMRFSTFAVPYIMGELRSCCYAAEAIRMPRSERAFRAKLHQARTEYLSSYGHEPTLNELSAILAMEPEELAQHMDVTQVVSLDVPISADDDTTWQDRLADDDPWLENLMLSDLLDRLPDDEHMLYLLRFQQRLSQQQTANCMALTQPQVSRMEAALRRKLADAWLTK